jgi:hypothetical protein
MYVPCVCLYVCAYIHSQAYVGMSWKRMNDFFAAENKTKLGASA